ncbi:MAG: FKBP-type peptidyl-prolyl cis-trans isomerase [Clostridiales bacterium]|jgi:trigger factor|nr:FKBP-type peptidyl-prolyl cis-trans isomerase [Clostridiales bacterium]
MELILGYALCLLLILAALAASLTGCFYKTEPEVTAQDSPVSGNDDPGVTDASEISDNAAANEPYVASANAFHFSDGIDDNGYWKDVRALDLVDLFDISAITIPADVHTIDPEAVESTISDYLSEYATVWRVTDTPVADGDTINIDYAGTIDGVKFEGGSTLGEGTNVTIGVTPYIEGFLEQIVGHTPGETISIHVTFPETYEAEELRGKDAVFLTTIHYIAHSAEPELIDAYVAEKFSASNNWNTVAEMRAGIEESLKSNSIDNYINNELIATTPVSSVPAALTQYETDSLVKYYLESANSYRMTLEDFLAGFVNSTSLEELIKSYADIYAQSSKESLVVQAIAEEAGIVVASDELQAYYYSNFNFEDFETFVGFYGEPYLKHVLLKGKVNKYIKEHAIYE